MEFEKECIVIDTNLLYNPNSKACDTDLTEFKLNLTYNKLLRFLEINELNDKYEIFIPEIVLDELEKQQEELYRTEINKLNSSYKCIEKFKGNCLKISNINYLDYIKNKRETYIKKEKIKILYIPKTSVVFEKIIERVKNKQKPFCGQKGNTDKGFKDVLLWESIIEQALIENYYKYILVTENSTDFIKNLEEEFCKKTGKQMNIFYEIEELQKYISDKNLINYDGLLIKKLIQSGLDTGELFDSIKNRLALTYKEEYDLADKVKIDNFIYEGNKKGSFFLVGRDSNNYLESEECFYIEFTIGETGDILIDEALLAI